MVKLINTSRFSSFMEEIEKTMRSNHDAHDLLLGILYNFPEEANWDEIKFHEALYKFSLKYRILDKYSFENFNGSKYCNAFGKVFDLLELSGLLKRKVDKTKLFLEVIRAHFDEEIKKTFEERDLNDISNLAEDLMIELNIA